MMPKTLADMREAMRKVMSDAYIKGSNDTIEAIKKAGHNAELCGARRASEPTPGYAGDNNGE